MKKNVTINEPFDTISYKDKVYVTRTFEVICEGAKRTYTIAIETLFEAFGEDMDKWDEQAHALDQSIYFYLEGEKITLSGKEICEEHLDEPMKFVKEIF